MCVINPREVFLSFHSSDLVFVVARSSKPERMHFSCSPFSLKKSSKFSDIVHKRTRLRMKDFGPFKFRTMMVSKILTGAKQGRIRI